MEMHIKRERTHHSKGVEMQPRKNASYWNVKLDDAQHAAPAKGGGEGEGKQGGGTNGNGGAHSRGVPLFGETPAMVPPMTVPVRSSTYMGMRIYTYMHTYNEYYDAVHQDMRVH